MAVSSSKEKILKKIRQALSNSVPVPFPKSEGKTSVYLPPVEELEVQFAFEFTKLLGKFAFCMDHADLKLQLEHLVKQKEWTGMYCREEKINAIISNTTLAKIKTDDLAGCDASLTSCEILVARTGSIVLSSANESGRTVSIYAPVHICIAYADQLVYDIKEGLQLLKDRYAGNMPSLISFATGPSRTADIEKTLVVGVHGPKEVYLFLVDKRG